MNVEIAKAKNELVRESAKAGNQICVLNTDGNPFVKIRRGYSYPEDVRLAYLAALHQLMNEGIVKEMMQSRGLVLYELISSCSAVTSIEHAKKLILQGARKSRFVFKVHSQNGEYVHVANQAYCDIDTERVLFLMALSQLVRHGQMQLVSDNCELARFELTALRSLPVQSDSGQLDSPVLTFEPGTDSQKRSAA